MQASMRSETLPSLQPNEIGTSELDPFRSSILDLWMEDVRRSIEDQASPGPCWTRSSLSLYRGALQGKDRRAALPSQRELRLRAGASGLPEVATFIADF
jgi:hypothetical protein